MSKKGSSSPLSKLLLRPDPSSKPQDSNRDLSLIELIEKAEHLVSDENLETVNVKELLAELRETLEKARLLVSGTPRIEVEDNYRRASKMELDSLLTSLSKLDQNSTL